MFCNQEVWVKTNVSLLLVITAVFGVASSPMANNFQKVTCGEARFKDIVTQNDSTDREESLISDILSLMADKTR